MSSFHESGMTIQSIRRMREESMSILSRSRPISASMSEEDRRMVESIDLSSIFGSIVEDTTNGQKPYTSDPLLSALKTQGVQIPQFVVQDASVIEVPRDFTVLDGKEVHINGYPVIAWDIPPTGCDTLMQTHLPNLRIATNEPVHHGSGYPSLTITALRPKHDGEEAVVVVAHTPVETHGYLFRPGAIEQVSAVQPGHYEIVTEDGNLAYCVLDGPIITGKVNRPSPWYAPTRENARRFVTSDGITVLANGLEYRVKIRRTVTVLVTSMGVCADREGNHYPIRLLPDDTIGKCVDAEEIYDGQFEFVKTRYDRQNPDHSDILKTVRRTATYHELLDYLPSSTSSNMPLTLFKPPPGMTPVTYRAYGAVNPAVGPQRWLSVRSDENYALATVDRFIQTHDKMERSVFLAWLVYKNKYIHGSRVRTVRPGSVLGYQQVKIGEVYYASEWWPGATKCVVTTVAQLKDKKLIMAIPEIVRPDKAFGTMVLIYYIGASLMSSESRQWHVASILHRRRYGSQDYLGD